MSGIFVAKEVTSDDDADKAAQASIESGRLQAEAQREAVAETRRQFDIQQQRLAPFYDIELEGARGLAGLRRQAQPELMALLGLSGSQAQMAAERGVLESPAQQALRDRALRGTLRTQAALGGLGGGNIRQALFEQGRVIDADVLARRRAELGGLSGSPGMQATALGGQLGGMYSQQIQQGIVGAGQALASGHLGAAQIHSQAGQARLNFLGNIIGVGAGIAAGG